MVLDLLDLPIQQERPGRSSDSEEWELCWFCLFQRNRVLPKKLGFCMDVDLIVYDDNFTLTFSAVSQPRLNEYRLPNFRCCGKLIFLQSEGQRYWTLETGENNLLCENKSL